MTATISPLSYISTAASASASFSDAASWGFEAINREEVSLGLYKTPTATASAIFSHEKSPAAKDGANVEGSHEACNSAPSSAQWKF
jgi:hypothetical protein